MIIDLLKRWLHWGNDKIPLGIVPRLLRSYLLWNNDWYGSHAIRYLPIVRFIRTFPNSIMFPILEVGSGDRGIAPFIKRSVVTIDMSFDLENLKRVGKINFPVRGKIENLPFSDDSFDIAIAVDLFEHLTEIQRDIAIKELFRVAKRYVVVAVPCGKKAACMEGILDRFHQKRFGVSNKWLVEHKKTCCLKLINSLKHLNTKDILLKLKSKAIPHYCYGSLLKLWKSLYPETTYGGS